MNIKEYLKTTLAVVTMLGTIKVLHGLVLKCIEKQNKMAKEWKL